MIGKFPAKLDEKNRLFVPAKLRPELGEDFYVTLGFSCGKKCLTVYTAGDFKKMEENYNNLSIYQRSDATALIFMNASQCNPDKQFRFGLPQFLLDYAGIKREVVIVGRAGQADIWDSETFKQYELENLTPEKLLASLEAIGL